MKIYERFKQAENRCHTWITMAAFMAALCGLGTLETACRRADTDNRISLKIRMDGGAERQLTLSELRANTGAVVIGTISLDKDGKGEFNFTNDSLSIYVLQTEVGYHTPLTLFFTPGSQWKLDANYDDVVGSARLRDRNQPKRKKEDAGRMGALDSLNLLPFQREQQSLARLLHETSVYLAEISHTTNVSMLYDSIVRELNHLYQWHKSESIRLGNYYSNTLAPIYLAQLQFGYRPLFDPQNPSDFEILNTFARDMKRQLPHNPHVQRFSQNLQNIEKHQRLKNFKNDHGRSLKAEDEALTTQN